MESVIKISDTFWNFRGVFKLKGLIDIGTHASLVKQKNGRFVLLDAYTFNAEQMAKLDELTNQGELVDAIINLHPFHTIHVKKAHELFPNAKLYGTCRHHERFPELPWEPEMTESVPFAELFADDFCFSVPRGVDFVSPNENLHFASVLAYHPDSKTIHSDDTLMYAPLPGVLKKLKAPEIEFHMTLKWTLERRSGAADEFKQWADDLAKAWYDAQHLCAAHTDVRLADETQTLSVADGIYNALAKVDKVLEAHRRKYG